MDLKLNEHVAIVTGAGQGIGEAISHALAAEGCDVVTADINIDTAKETEKKIEFLGRKALPIKVDVSKDQEAKRMVDATIEKFGKIDILVNNAGISPRKPDGSRTLVMEMSEEEFDRVIATDLKGVFNCSKYVIQHMIRRCSGNIVNISSTAAKLTDLRSPSGAHYNAAKAGVSNFTTSLASEVAQYNIRVNAVAPGRIRTALMKTTTPEFEARFLKNIPLGRVGLPEDIANAVLFLVSHLSSYITGQILYVNGGLWMG
jgi:NAD(P)-dependent dehydrogenase (short-subunit alcohol dehydrogenase family)